ncbi:quinolinate synthase [Wolffia australiana]
MAYQLGAPPVAEGLAGAPIYVHRNPSLISGGARRWIRQVLSSPRFLNRSNSTVSCSAIAPRTPSAPSSTFGDGGEVTGSRRRLQKLADEFHALPEPIERVKRLLDYAGSLPPLPDSDRTAGNRVMGCTAQVWVTAFMDERGRMHFSADSDSEITRGFCACLISVLDGAAPEEVLGMGTEDLGELSILGSAAAGKMASRVNAWHNVLLSMQKRTRAILANGNGDPLVDPFPSLVITVDGVTPKGSYAEAQAKYLLPDSKRVNELVNVLKEKKIGVVAHFYMDPEVQGVLTAAQKLWPHIHISDSLVMADRAVDMAKAGCEYIAVLGVDFMSENVRAILDQSGFQKVVVYRMSSDQIGCSLADAAASQSYLNFLEEASRSRTSLHVIYINTSLETKAQGHELVPTITCTSSNVVQTILQAFAQLPDMNVYYGPDSYMGANIVELFRQMSRMPDEEIALIHPKHNRESISSLLPRLHYFQDGTCIVHHLFGQEVVEKIKEVYCDAFLTAHFEVPGEMFSLAMEAKGRGMGVVGSTQNILDFIKQKVQEALDRDREDCLKFVLGTESGMITSIVAAVRHVLNSNASPAKKIEVEIVFPVSSDSLSTASDDNKTKKQDSSEALNSINLSVIPGVSAGEGCSIHGGCASCPYMKMNSLSSLLRICCQLPDEKNLLMDYEAKRFSSTTPKGRSVADIGCEPILHMRHFQANKELPQKLVHQILERHKNNTAIS